mmetsp:Transcript_56248/g.148437  ORF Transcript_56248/g.148437 Transcript_56248/m.148437 type:complete len:89 (-) Transcript_56248:106-372(-)
MDLGFGGHFGGFLDGIDDGERFTTGFSSFDIAGDSTTESDSISFEEVSGFNNFFESLVSVSVIITGTFVQRSNFGTGLLDSVSTGSTS